MSYTARNVTRVHHLLLEQVHSVSSLIVISTNKTFLLIEPHSFES